MKNFTKKVWVALLMTLTLALASPTALADAEIDSLEASTTYASEGTSFWDDVKSVGSGIYQGVKEKAPGWWETAKDKASDVATTVKENGPEWVEAAKDKGAELVEKGSAAYQSASEQVSGFLDDQQNQFWERTEQLIYGDSSSDEPEDELTGSATGPEIPDEKPDDSKRETESSIDVPEESEGMPGALEEQQNQFWARVEQQIYDDLAPEDSEEEPEGPPDEGAASSAQAIEAKPPEAEVTTSSAQATGIKTPETKDAASSVPEATPKNTASSVPEATPKNTASSVPEATPKNSTGLRIAVDKASDAEIAEAVEDAEGVEAAEDAENGETAEFIEPEVAVEPQTDLEKLWDLSKRDAKLRWQILFEFWPVMLLAALVGLFIGWLIHRKR